MAFECTPTEVLSVRDIEKSLETSRPLHLHYVVKGERYEIGVQPIGREETLLKYTVLARLEYQIDDKTLDGTLTLELISDDVGYRAILELE